MHPYILYGLEVYVNTCPSYLDKLTVLNNKLLRILQNKGHRPTCCNESLYLQYNTLPPVQLFNYHPAGRIYRPADGRRAAVAAMSGHRHATRGPTEDRLKRL